MPSLVVDKHPRPGDQWRNRYKSLCLHDPVWYDHLPYIKFPDTWPVFAPRTRSGTGWSPTSRSWRCRTSWLVPAVGRDRLITARLDLTGEPVLELTSGRDPWRVALTRRHAEILRLIAAAGPAGTTAGRLSEAVWGDAEHTVTVRVEISRMRRVIGALVTTNPYRLTDRVSLDVSRPRDPGQD